MTLYDRRRPPDVVRAVWDDEYYAAVHKTLRGVARAAFERAVDEAWRAKHELTTTGRN